MDFKEGNHVKVSVAHQFKGYKIGTITGTCKDGHPLVYIHDPDLITKTACIDPERGDTIVKITKS